MKKYPTLFVALGLSITALWAVAQPPADDAAADFPAAAFLLHQERDNQPAKLLPSAELAQLGDPFFELVLKKNAVARSLSEIEHLLQSATALRRTFVVDERIADPGRPQARRAVLAYTGPDSRGKALDGNVMLSVFFDSESFADSPRFIEAWGWDDHRGRYNYYKLDRTGTPDARMTWKFRGSSVGADLLNASERKGTCMGCHINGAPIMKELFLPWNNWHSFESRATYLTALSNPADRWPVASDPKLSGKRLGGAEQLETMLVPAFHQFSNRRINSALERRSDDGNLRTDEQGFQRVLEGRRLLRHLFETTEYNIISSRSKSNLHPLPAENLRGPAGPLAVPANFFLNADLLASNAFGKIQGLGISASREFGEISILPEEYTDLVRDSRMMIASRLGDADFAWLTPEPGFMDNVMVDRLIHRGLVTPDFAAAVLAVDLETPILSAERSALLIHVPENFKFEPLQEGQDPVGRHPDDLTSQVIASLQAASPVAGSPEAFLLERLQAADPLTLLRQDVERYLARVREELDASPERRKAELERLHSLLIERRRAVLEHPILEELNESGDRLFPAPAP